MLLFFFRPHVYGASPIPTPNFVRFTDESYDAPSVEAQSYEGDAEDL